ncbi:amino acid racemase [Paenibacillus sp. HN-1]|uniref:aspartate/glutamate racemase family protein n=1 Tax=Paenibacillus TaxID=44249 RepID=UPI001CA82481|nr:MULTISPECIES: amino acid racemase [Paenibacillus]MBY9081594.1 amino acid racemase [Paenibacillus sp. CGMCC 1.18879]MBY9083463.1 amino acid racemase [Paenibacillus sinensis]
MAQEGNWEKAAEYLASGIHALEKAGADFAVISANMPHIAFDLITEHVSLPLIHIADVVAEAARSSQYNKIALIGTKPTMNAKFYPDRLSNYDVECIVPSEGQQDMISRVLEAELFKGIINEGSRTSFLNLINDLKTRGAEAIILGCTELPMLINSENSPLPLLDSALLLAQAALDEAVYGVTKK